VSPGFREFVVEPCLADLVSAAGVVPSPSGPIEVAWRVEKGKLSVSIKKPAGTVGTLVLSRYGAGELPLEQTHTSLTVPIHSPHGD
jgi:hypothetical protein